MCSFVAQAWSSSMQITLNGKGWHVVSTPAILSSIQFSNGWYWISFSKLENWQWVSVPANATNIKPLEGYMVYNNNTSNVTMTLNYKTWVTANESLLQKSLNYGWNLLWIVTISNPFNNITWATMSVDFTNNGSSNYTNRVNSSYRWNTAWKNVTNLQLGEAYWMFVNERESIYGWVNNWWVYVPNSNVDCNDPMTIIACTTDTDACPVECRNSEVVVSIKNTYYANPKVTYWETNILMLSWKIYIQEPVLISFDIKARNTTNWIAGMAFNVWNEKYQWVKSIEWVDTVFSFNNIILNQTEDFGITLDVEDDSSIIWNTFNFSPNFDKDIFTSIKSINTNEEINRDLIWWSITFPTVSIQFPEITENNSSSYSNWTEFYVNENAEESVFNLKYSVTKWDVYIDSIYLEWTDFNDTNIISLKWKVWWVDVWTLRIWESNKLTFTPIKVENNKSINIYIYALVDWYEEAIYNDLKLYVNATDSMWHPVRQVAVEVYPIKVIEKKITLSCTPKYNIRVKWNWSFQKFTSFTFNSNTYNTINELTISFSWDSISSNDVKLVDCFDCVSYVQHTYTPVLETNWNLKFLPNFWLSKDNPEDLDLGIKSDKKWYFEIKITSLNGEPRDVLLWKIKYVEALVSINSQTDLWGWLTRYTFNVSHYGDETTIQHLTLSYTDMDKIQHNVLEYDVDSTSILEVLNTSEVSIMVNWISYYVCGEEYDESNDLNDCEYVEIKKADFPDFFLVDGVYAKVFGSD